MSRATPLLSSLLLLAGTNASALDFNGYLRAGMGSNSEGGDQVCFQLPGARSKYRLGNECEAYGALRLGETVHQGADGSTFRVSTLFAFNSPAEHDWEEYDTAIREVYVEGSGFGDALAKPIHFWVGKRLLRQDVHITDFFYWDNSGSGAGFYGLALGPGKLSYSLVHNVSDVGFDNQGSLNNGSDRAMLTHDLRLGELPSNPDGSVTIGLAWIQADESRDGFDGENGWQLHLQHEQRELVGGFNRLALQYGSGAGATLGRTPDDTAANSDRTWRVIEQLMFQPSANWSGMTTAVFESQRDHQEWLSFGVRPIYHFTDHFNLALEFGHDRVDPEIGAVRTLNKLTLAPQLSAGRGFFSRPVLRLFVTYADWNDAARDAGLAGGSSGLFGSDTEGFSYGFQAEAWW